MSDKQTESDYQLNSIEEALVSIRKGELIIVVDDENRENEGDLICAAELITPEIVNFMATHGRGLICAALPESRCKELELSLMVSNNSSKMETPFTVSVDALRDHITTGISAADRSTTISLLASYQSKAHDFSKPGHIFPLAAKDGGVLRRAGHTEAASDLARLAGCSPVGVLVEIMNEDGTMARLPELRQVAKKFKLKIISIKDLIAYRMQRENLINKEVVVKLPTQFAEFDLHAYTEAHTENHHLALTLGSWQQNDPVLVRVHSSCFTGDIIGSLRCDCGDQLKQALKLIAENGSGVLLYMNQEGRGIGLINKLRAYKLQEEGMDTVEANLALGFKMDQRDYGIGAQILGQLGVRKIRLMSNNFRKRVALSGYGLEIVENVPLEMPANQHNQKYLQTKKDKLGHDLGLGKIAAAEQSQN